MFCLPADEASPGAAVLAPLRWSGLAWLSPKLVSALPDELDAAQLGPWLIAQALERGAVRAVHTRITTRTSRDWVAAQRAALVGEIPGLLLGGRESSPGVWPSRNARVHPEARVVAPSWIGEDARVERGAVVGPGAVVGAGSIVDANTRVEAALILPGTYLGESMELKHAVADRGVVTHTRIGATVSIADPFLVGPIRTARVEAAGTGPLGRLLAVLALAAGAPLILLDADASAEDRAAADAWYAGTRSTRHDAWLFARYLREVVLAQTRSHRPSSIRGDASMSL